MPNLSNAILIHELDLSSNSLNSFDELFTGAWLPFLAHLRLSNNSLQELSSIRLPSLVELELAFNQLDSKHGDEGRDFLLDAGLSLTHRYSHAQGIHQPLSVTRSIECRTESIAIRSRDLRHLTVHKWNTTAESSVTPASLVGETFVASDSTVSQLPFKCD